MWLYNCEDLTITLTGDHTYGADFARYASLPRSPCNPLVGQVTLHCVGVVTEVALIDPDRIAATPPAPTLPPRSWQTPSTPSTVPATTMTTSSPPAHQAGADTWHARLLLVDATTEPTAALTQLLTLLAQHPGATGSSVILAGAPQENVTGTVLQVTSTGRVRLAQAGLDLVAVGLTSDEAMRLRRPDCRRGEPDRRTHPRGGHRGAGMARLHRRRRCLTPRAHHSPRHPR